MDVYSIVKKYLEDYGYDGLCDEMGECGCDLADLAPCGNMQAGCQAGRRKPCNCGDGHDFDLVAD